MKKILVIEDDPALSGLMADFCEFIGVEPLLALNGKEGLAKAEEKPDLITVDHRLPDMTGLDVIARLKSNPTTQAIPLLYVSADAHLHESEAKAKGAAGVLVKPVSADGLEKALISQLGPL